MTNKSLARIIMFLNKKHKNANVFIKTVNIFNLINIKYKQVKRLNHAEFSLIN